MRFPLAFLSPILLLLPACSVQESASAPAHQPPRPVRAPEAPAPGQPSPERNYRSEEGKYTVRFPKEPTISNKELATTAGVLKVQTAKCDAGKDVVLSVSHTTYPANFGDVDATKILDGVRDGLKGSDGEVKVDKALTLGEDKVPARDVRIEAGKNGIRTRLILVDRRLLQVMAVGKTEALEGKAVEEFFKSFELAK